MRHMVQDTYDNIVQLIKKGWLKWEEVNSGFDFKTGEMWHERPIIRLYDVAYYNGPDDYIESKSVMGVIRTYGEAKEKVDELMADPGFRGSAIIKLMAYADVDELLPGWEKIFTPDNREGIKRRIL